MTRAIEPLDALPGTIRCDNCAEPAVAYRCFDQVHRDPETGFARRKRHRDPVCVVHAKGYARRYRLAMPAGVGG